jgi:hypothetical protein
MGNGRTGHNGSSGADRAIRESRRSELSQKLEALRLGPRVGSAILAMSWNGDLPNVGEGSCLAPCNSL